MVKLTELITCFIFNKGRKTSSTLLHLWVRSCRKVVLKAERTPTKCKHFCNEITVVSLQPFKRAVSAS